MISTFFFMFMPAMGADLHPAGSPVEEAVGVAVSAAGLSDLSGAAAVLVPTDPVALDGISMSGGTWCINYEFSLSNANVTLEIDEISIVPTSGALQIEMDLLVAINDAGDKFDLGYELLCIGEDCPGYVKPFLVEAAVPLGIRVVNDSAGEPVFDAVLGTPSVTHYLESSDIELDCNIGTVEEVLDYFGLSIFDLIIEAAEDSIQDAVTDAMEDLEAQLDEALAQARLEETIDIQGAEIQLTLEPAKADIDTSGLQLVMRGLAEVASVSDCVAEYDPGGSLATSSVRPGVSDLPAGVETAGLVADEFINQLMYAVWRGGVLCYRLDENSDLGLPINSSLLGIIGGEPFDALFPEPKELVIQTDPQKAPVVEFGSEHDLTLVAEDLDVNFYADLDYRMARALGVSIQANIGVDVQFNGTTGAMDVVLDLEGDAIQIVSSGNELAPETDQVVADGMSALLQTALDTLLADALSGLSFQLGSVQGLGLQSLALESAGSNGDWLLASVDVGPVPYGAGGCDDSGGCGGDTDGCGQGCSNGRAGMWPLWLIGLPFGLLLRRRSARGVTL